jgi:hypothetical protein
LARSVKGIESRFVQIGNRHIKGFNFYQIGNVKDTGWCTKSLTYWKALSVKVTNMHDYNINWKWKPEDGYPNQFSRNRIVALDRIAASPGHCGYSGWSQMQDGTIVILDYTVGGNGGPPAKMPFIRAYITSEDALAGNKTVIQK